MFSKNIAITDTTDGLPNPRRIWAVIAASLALIMSVLDANIVNVVLPTLSREFGTSPSTTIWVMNAYQLAITVSLLSFSSPGDIYGYHKVFLSGVAVFCVTSLICVLSTSFWMLTVARVLQGFGASAITSVNTAQLRTIYPRKYLGRGLGISAMVVAVSAVCCEYHPFVRKLAMAFCDQYPPRPAGFDNGPDLSPPPREEAKPEIR